MPGYSPEHLPIHCEHRSFCLLYTSAIDALADERSYIMGLEESYGYLVGRHARDKDAVSAAMMIVEMAAYYRSQGKSLIDALEELYEAYGYYTTSLFSKTYKGKSGKEEMDAVLAGIRREPWKKLLGRPVLAFKDYLQGIEGLPKSDVLSFRGEGFRAVSYTHLDVYKRQL